MATDRHQAPSYPLRMPDELKAQVQIAASESGRSMHGELLHRLQRSFDAPQSEVLDVKIVQLEAALKATQDATQFVLSESTQQIAALARSNEAARYAADELLADAELACQIAIDVLDGEAKDPKGVRAEIDGILNGLTEVDQRLSETMLPPLRPLSAVFRAKADELDERGHDQGS